MVVSVTDIIVPHHVPNISPAKINNGKAKPNNQTHRTENKKKIQIPRNLGKIKEKNYGKTKIIFLKKL